MLAFQTPLKRERSANFHLPLTWTCYISSGLECTISSHIQYRGSPWLPSVLRNTHQALRDMVRTLELTCILCRVLQYTDNDYLHKILRRNGKKKKAGLWGEAPKQLHEHLSPFEATLIALSMKCHKTGKTLWNECACASLSILREAILIITFPLDCSARGGDRESSLGLN